MKSNRKSRIDPQMRKMLTLAGNPIWKAIAKEPLHNDIRIGIALTCRESLYRLSLGDGTADDIEDLFSAVHTALILAERGYGPEIMDQINLAKQSLQNAKDRPSSTRTFKVDSQDVIVISEFIELHEMQIDIAEKSEVISAMTSGMKRARIT